MVFAAWTQPALLVRWFAPGENVVTDVEADIREGGRYRVEALDSDNRPYSISGTYLELVDGERIVLSWNYDGPVAALRTKATLVTADLREISPMLTELTLTHEKNPSREAAGLNRANWKSCLAKLEAASQSIRDKPALDETPKDFFSEGHRKIQDHFGTRRLADRLGSLSVHDELKAADAAFIARQNMFFIASNDPYGQPNCSYKGGARGFVTVVDEQTLAFPDYNGNGMHLTTGNISETSKVGLLFIDFERQARLRVLGRAEVSTADSLIERYPGAQMIVRVHVESVFSNCPRYVHKMQLVEESAFIPGEASNSPTPDWKRLLAVADALPESDADAAGTDTDGEKAMNRDS
ncbi:SRPBCC domain-containing protein [Methyloceanibacter methanicus]|uniref:SRPBCC domain-containing protein n=1 Tax=Methyloceanibacter methanicus TaxID=1774968 RepID=UPI00195DD3E3|nr:SRPBCC domain-containing protein [Methyloceanibacter methanicus]